MNKLTEWLIDDLLEEDVKLDIKVGDTVLMGRFKNKRVVVKSIDFNEKGDMLINGRPALKFRMVKPKKALLPVSRTDKGSVTKDPDMKGVKEKMQPSTHYGYYKVIKGKKIIQFKGSKSAARSEIKKARKKDPKGKYQLINTYKKGVGDIFEEFGAPAGMLPSPSRKGINKNKTDKKSGYKKVDEANAVKGSKVSKFITGHNLTMKGKKYKEIEFETLGVDNSSKMVKLRILAPKNLFGIETPVKFSTLRRGPFTKTETGKKVNENIEKTLDLYIKNVVYSITNESLPTKVSDKIKKLKHNPKTDAEKDFMKHHTNSMGADKMGRLSEPDTYDWDDDDKEEGGYQKEKDKKKKGYEPVSECVTIGQKIGNDVILGKNRDRNYSPNIMMVRELLNDETEACYLVDDDTDWVEGINSHGIGIVNSALFVKRDEKDYDKSKKKMAPSKDGKRIRQALSYNNLKDVVASLVNFEKGIKGHTTVSDGKKMVVIENTSRTKPTVKIHDLNVPVVRSNHGITHPEQGYTRGPDRVSSETRMKYAMDIVKTIKDYKKLFPALYNHTQKLGPKFDVVRSQNKLWTSSQLLYNLNKLKVMLYLIPGKVHFKGIVNKLPNGYKSKIDLEIRQYEHSPDDKYDTFVTTDKVKKPDILDKKIDVEESKLQENKIKRIIGIYGGRFQPFGPHHLRTYQWLESKVDEAYITTSDIKKPPRHPMNFSEKVRHMAKMGVPASRIVKEKTPYVANNTLSKFDPKTTAVVYIFGKKDAGRLQGGTKKSGGKTYYQDYNQNRNNLVGFEEHGYILTAPHTSISVAGMEISGTTMRNILGSPKIKDEDRPKVFKKLFGYYDKGVYNMMTNKFKKLFEFIKNTKSILKEVSGFGPSFKASSLSDEGFYDFFKTFKDYKRVSPKHAEILGWSVVDDIIGKNATSSRFDFLLRKAGTGGAVDTVTFGKTINQNSKNTSSVKNPFPKYQRHMRKMMKDLGWEVVKFMGKKTVDIEDSELMDMMKVLSTKEREKVLKEQKELLLMGGAYGHMSHPFDNNDLTFGDLKNIITLGLGGKLDREDGVTEKLDGQNLMISWVNGELKAARNKGHLKNKGATAPNTDGVKKIFAGRGNVEKAFVSAMIDLSRAIKGLSEAQKEKIFGNGSKWMNLEIMYPATANVVDYDVAEIVFHGTLEYDDSGSPIGQPKDSARMLAGMIKQVNANVQKTFKIGKPNFLTVPKTQDFGKKKSRFLGRLAKIQSEYALRDTNRLGEYHQAFWQEYVFNASKQFGVNLKPNQFVQLVNRWAYFDKSYKVPMIKKDYKDNPKFLDWILSTDKNDHAKIFKQNIQPIETLFFEVGAEILKNISGYMAASPDITIQKMRKEVESALRDLRSGGSPEKLKKLKLQIEKLEAIGGVNAIVPSEGIVFKYKGNVYKFTGAFAPINQILGSLKFG